MYHGLERRLAVSVTAVLTALDNQLTPRLVVDDAAGHAGPMEYARNRQIVLICRVR